MDSTELSKLVDELNYLLARISKYLKNNQYIYLRAFDSWKDSYNLVAAHLNAGGTVNAPVFKLSPVDYSPSKKSINQECVREFVKTISRQVARLEDKIIELNKAAEEKLAQSSPLEIFFHRAVDGTPIVPPSAEHRIFVAIPAGEADLKLFWQGIQPALETQGLSFFRADRLLLNDAAFCELCQELHSCRLAIVNLSGQAPNVMLAMGLAYGIGKPVIILQRQNDETLGEMNNNGYICYANADDLKTSLRALLPQLLAPKETDNCLQD
jgi:hypothetical protein